MFRFTIRDVLWLTVVVAVLAAWLINIYPLRSQPATDEQAIIQALADDNEALNAQVELQKKLIENWRRSSKP